MKCHETNEISQNFSGITIDFCEIAKSFVDFCFCFCYLRKMTAKFQFLSKRFEISKFHTFRWQKLLKSISQLPTKLLSDGDMNAESQRDNLGF